MKALAAFSPIPSPVLGKLKHFKSQTDINTKSNPVPQNTSYVDLHMHSAVISGNIGMIRFALDNGQSIHSSVNGLQAIHVAAGFGQLAILKYLITRGANVNCRRGSTMPDGTEINNEKIRGPTPLHFAASNGHGQVVDYLLERGADPDIEDQYGCTPIDIALAQGYTDIYKSLMEYSVQNDSISVPQMPSAMTNIKPSPKVIPGSPNSQSMTTPKLQYQNKISTPNLQYQRKNSTPTIVYQNKSLLSSRSPVVGSPPEYPSINTKSPKVHNIKNGLSINTRSPVMPSSQSKSPVTSRFNVVYNSKDYVQPRIRRGVSEKNIKLSANDDLIYDTQKVSKNNNSPLFIKDGNLISSSYQVSSNTSYMNNNESYPLRSESVKSTSTFKGKNLYEMTNGTIDNNGTYFDAEPYVLSDSDDEYLNGQINDEALEKYTDSYSDSDIVSPASSSFFEPSPPKSMTQLYRQNSNLFKSKPKPLTRSNSSSSNRRKFSNGSLKTFNDDRELSSKVGDNASASQNSKAYYRSRSRSNSRSEANAIPNAYFRSRSNSRPDINIELSNSSSYRPRSNSKPEIAINYSGSRSRSISNMKLETMGNKTGNSSSNNGNSNTTNNDLQKSYSSRSRSHSRSEHSKSKSRSESRSESRSVSRTRSRSNSQTQTTVTSKLSNNKLSTSNVNSINNLFNFTSMKNSINSPEHSPSSYSSDFSAGSFSDKELLYAPSPSLSHSQSVTSVSNNNTNMYTTNLKPSITDNQLISSSYYNKGKSKYPNYSNVNSYSSHHLYSSSSQSKIPLSTKTSKSSIDPSQQSYNSMKNVAQCFPEGIMRNRSHSNSQVNSYTSLVNRARSYSNNLISSKSTSPYNKPAQTIVNSNFSNQLDSSLKSKLNDPSDQSLPRSSSD